MVPEEKARLEKRLESVTEKLLGAFEELDFLHSLGEVLGNPDGVEDLDSYLLEETLRIFRGDGGWVLRRNPPGPYQVTAVRGLVPGVVERLTAHVVEERAAGGKLPWLVDDLHRVLRTRAAAMLADETGEKGAAAWIPRAFLAVPLSVGRDAPGVICLGKREPGRVFTSGDQKLLVTLATQAGFYVKTADLMRRFKTEAQNLGRRLERLEADSGAQPDISWLKGRSPLMRQLARQVESAAATDATVLLLGESGTGKSLVARILHRMSARRHGPFVEVNCGAVPAALIESELFGHARGAFTGADRDRPGLFEEASRGTLLLDEIGELPMESQVKLLTVLEQRRARRVGENRDRPVDARVVAATNSDLPGDVRRGRFREDLFYRLNVITLTVPPLRDRPEEILPLARRFLEELAPGTHRRVRGFTREAESALLAYRWPGNVRELRNVVERSLLLKGEGGLIELSDLPVGAAPAAAAPVVEVGAPLPEALETYERALLLRSLEAEDGVVARAARRLGISRTNFHNKLRKHGLLRDVSWSDDSHK